MIMASLQDSLRSKCAVVVGLGKSGLAAARLLSQAGAHVHVNDKKTEAELGQLAIDARALDVKLHFGGHPDALFESADLIVLSPGVPVLSVVEKARARGAKVISEVELASYFITSPIVGITGTNGKSTVTTLIGEMLTATGKPTFTGGNLGDALTLCVGSEASKYGHVVAELSSFQLEDIETMRCQVAVLLNVTDDHLDRHGTFAAYAAAKGRIFATQTAADHAIVPEGDALCISIARAGAGTLHTYGGEKGEVRVEGGAIVDTVSGLRVLTSELGIRGLHNQANACAAALAARLAGAPRDVIAAILRSFRGLPHRMVHIRELEGVVYFNDSKATNVGATVAALDGLKDLAGKVVLIAGGLDKGGSYAPVRERMEANGRGLVLIGQATPIIQEAFAGSALPVVLASSMDDAVIQARALAQRGDAILLAPACASMDMFRNYAHRGDEFARAAKALGATP
jgi:UDP-N-acetylmuramoylalanine--D-glutamate ligase